MPTVRVRGSTAVFEADLTTSLLNVLLRGGYPLRTLCGGRAECGRDLIRIVSGGEFLSPVRERERKKLAALAAAGVFGPAGDSVQGRTPPGADLRLACQCYARGDVEIEIVGVT
ncbi:MAG TPA: ferredoxin [Spirochaetia bacterium]